jgi:hypothetical protein
MMESASQDHLRDPFSASAESTDPILTISSPVAFRDSAAIRRLMDEVNYEEVLDLSAGYNRMHNRHNR